MELDTERYATMTQEQDILKAGGRKSNGAVHKAGNHAQPTSTLA
jgi:hypothetical protein